MLRAATLTLALVLAPAAAPAHPHVFIDGGVDFIFDAQGRLSDLRVTWIYDPLTSLFMLEDLQIDPTAALGQAERERLAAYQTQWDDSFAGDSYLWDGERRIGLSGPREASAELIDGGKVAISFLRRIDRPFRPGDGTLAKIYDPTFFTAYFVTESPRLEGLANGCRARVVPFEPDRPLAALQQNLSSLGIDESPEDPDIGSLFAERVYVTCD